MLTFDEAAHVYRWDGEVVPSVTQVLHAWSGIARLDESILAAARQLGTDVHLATALDDQDDLDSDSVDEMVLPYLQAWRIFCEFEDFEAFEVERMVYSKRHGYAGTFDRYGRMRKRRKPVLLDIKTGTPDPTHGPQTAAYAEAADLGVNGPDRCTVYLQPGRKPPYLVEWHKSAGDLAIFLAALTHYRWRERYGL